MALSATAIPYPFPPHPCRFPLTSINACATIRHDLLEPSFGPSAHSSKSFICNTFKNRPRNPFSCNTYEPPPRFAVFWPKSPSCKSFISNICRNRLRNPFICNTYKNTGVGVPLLQNVTATTFPLFQFNSNVRPPAEPQGSFSAESPSPSAGSRSRCIPDPAPCLSRTTGRAALLPATARSSPV